MSKAKHQSLDVAGLGRMEMNSEETSKSDFNRLLREVMEHPASLDVLLEDPLFNSRLRLIAMTLAPTTRDAEELASDVRNRVRQKLHLFKPDDRNPYRSFFSWIRALTRMVYLNTLRHRKVELDHQQSLVEQASADTQTEIEASVFYKEVMAEFKAIINALPERERLTVVHYLQRTTKAKKEFYTIVDHVINSGTPAITPEEICKLASTGTIASQPRSRPGWESANDLLQKMQSPESKQGIQAAFEASPEELGRAAVEHADQGKVPVSSLTTYLMAASTVNVVGRVMNLTKNAT